MACFDKAKSLLGIAGELGNVTGFRKELTSSKAATLIPKGGMEFKYKHYCQAINYVTAQLFARVGSEVADEFYVAAHLALALDMKIYMKKLDEIKEKKALLSKEKAPFTEAQQTTLQEAPEEASASTTEQTENKDIARNVVKRNVVRTEKAEKRRKEILNLLKNRGCKLNCVTSK
jgi:hypothetical protein